MPGRTVRHAVIWLRQRQLAGLIGLICPHPPTPVAAQPANSGPRPSETEPARSQRQWQLVPATSGCPVEDPKLEVANL